ncbi:MAG: PilT protein domain protein [Candidatus Woesebacteria bacterium GW2011_GWB1_38_5b]|uniref:PilT protein domain protein n=1 Tax=Candidatus Woesebacteria bacterium GW2011_GWB1_38_5b TaxID=1618569 RepID=A0A0G0KIB8_9BACT|nr:MAG: PilT protein domain protein [Candidatus Woesebacteria bacterium GW2011_GWB1_38_5b]
MNYFLDANIFLRYITNDSKYLSPKAEKVFQAIGKREINGFANILVLHEVIYTLEHAYNTKRNIIVEKISKLIKLSNLDFLDIDKIQFLESLRDYERIKVDFPDCIYKQIAKKDKLKILSFDKDFQRINIQTTTDL